MHSIPSCRTHLNAPEASLEALQPGKDQRGLEVPLHHRGVLEVAAQGGPPVQEGVLVAAADPQGVLEPLQPLLRLHAEDLLGDEGLGLWELAIK